MKNIKTIPFNWDTYQSDKSNKYTLVTRGGDPITQLTKFDIEDQPSELYGVNTEMQEVYGWQENGSYYRNETNDLMLQYEEEVVGSWVNVHQDVSGQYLYVGATYSTMKEAMKYAASEGYVTTINLNDIVCK